MKKIIGRISIIPLLLITWAGLLSSLPPGFEEKMNRRQKNQAEFQRMYDSLNAWSIFREDEMFDPVVYEILAPARYQTFLSDKGNELIIWHKSHIAEKNDKLTSIFYFWKVRLDTLYLYPRIRAFDESSSIVKNNTEEAAHTAVRNRSDNSHIIWEAIEIDNTVEKYIIQVDSLKLVASHNNENEVYTKY